MPVYLIQPKVSDQDPAPMRLVRAPRKAAAERHIVEGFHIREADPEEIHRLASRGVVLERVEE